MKKKLSFIVIFPIFLFFGWLLPIQNIKTNRPKNINYKIINIYPHPPNSFTQGLFYENGILYEGTGQYGHSSIRKLDLKTGNILKLTRLSSNYFGEGITSYENKIIQLTWMSNSGFIYNKDNLELIKSFKYPKSMEGWGLTSDGTHLIMSDGSPTLFFLDPESFEIVKQINVTFNNKPIYYLNELEYIRGSIFANVWQSELILRINPKTGIISGIINLEKITPPEYRNHIDYVLNGIAFIPDTGHLLVTGKMWPLIYQIELLSD